MDLSEVNAPRTTGSPRSALVALLAILVLASSLRVVALSWDLRQAPERDEAVFVGSVVEMIRHHDLEQRFYEYPGLLFQVLRAALVWLSTESLGTARAYLVARGVVAAFGVLSVALTYLLGARLVSPRAGLVAALVLAVSPVEVTTAHMVRPDVVLEAFALLTLLSLRAARREPGSDAVSGLALGAAGAVKFTGAALIPSVILHRWLEPGRRFRGIVVAGVVSVAVFVAATPDLFLHPAAFLKGFGLQWGYHYPRAPGRPVTEASLPFYLGTFWDGLGPAACAFAAVGLWEARLRWRAWAPLLVFPPTLLLLLLSSDVHWSRLVIPAFGAVSVIAGLGFERVALRAPRVAWTVALAGCLLPLSSSLLFLRLASQPGTRDRALDWIAEHVPPGGQVLTSVEGLGLDPARYEILTTSGVAWADRQMVRMVDGAVLRTAEAGALRLPAPALALASSSTVTGPELALFASLPAPGTLREVSTNDFRLTSSSDEAGLSLAVDGRLDTHWKTARSDCADEWIGITTRREIRLARIDLVLGRRPSRAGAHVTLEAARDDDPRHWHAVPTVVYRSAWDDPEKDEPEAHRQVLVFEPVVGTEFRVEADCPDHQRWGFAEIRLYEQDSAPGR
jgi:Dolichyl-phosphate-mannose-protein mannosyltransferase